MMSYLRVTPLLAKTIRMPTANAVERAKALVSPIFDAEAAALYDEPASWALCDLLRAPRDCDARHQSLREAGVAPDYPAPEQFVTGEVGRMILTPSLLSLQPDDGSSVLSIAPSMMRRAIFYGDAFELEATGLGTLVIRASGIDRIDAIFHAYFWPRALPLRA